MILRGREPIDDGPRVDGASTFPYVCFTPSQATTSHPSSVDAAYRLGKCLHRLKHLEEAKEALLQATR